MKISKKDIAIIVATVAIAAPVMFMPDLNSETPAETDGVVKPLEKQNTEKKPTESDEAEVGWLVTTMWDELNRADRKEICRQYREDRSAAIANAVEATEKWMKHDWKLLFKQEC